MCKAWEDHAKEAAERAVAALNRKWWAEAIPLMIENLDSTATYLGLTNRYFDLIIEHSDLTAETLDSAANCLNIIAKYLNSTTGHFDIMAKYSDLTAGDSDLIVECYDLMAEFHDLMTWHLDLFTEYLNLKKKFEQMTAARILLQCVHNYPEIP